MAFLEIDGLQKSFGANQVVRNFDLKIEQGEFISLLGPSGCGKTTVLRMVAGFEEPRNQPATDVAGGAGHQHGPGVLCGVGMRSFRRLQRNSCGWG